MCGSFIRFSTPVYPGAQWVLSLPFALRYRLAYNRGFVGDVLQIFAQAVFGSLQRRALEQHGIQQAQRGPVTFVQRFGGSLNLAVVRITT